VTANDHICTGPTCMFCRVGSNLPTSTPTPSPRRRTSAPRLGQRDTHVNIEIQVLERVKELEQRAILNNLERKEELTKDEEVERLAFVDGLTSLYNRRTFTKEMTFEVKRAKRYKRPISFCLVLVDNLKEISRKYGALTADMTLKSVAQVIQGTIREIDITARYTSDHFAILMPETNAAGAAVVTDRVRQRIKKQTVTHGRLALNITASLGLTSFPSQAKDLEDLIARANVALETAIEEGGDRYLLV
jgi:two-component system cell cycle response regulator